MLELSHEDNSRFWHLVGVSWHARLLHLSVSSGVRIKDYVSIPFVVDPRLICKYDGGLRVRKYDQVQ
jgi:hypothetical protein